MIRDEIMKWLDRQPGRSAAIMGLALKMGVTEPTVRRILAGVKSPTEAEAVIIRAHIGIGPATKTKRRKP